MMIFLVFVPPHPLVSSRAHYHVSLQDKIVALTDAGTEADARAHVAQAAANRSELGRSRLEQEKALVESKAKWLDEELARKSELLQSERRASSAQVGSSSLQKASHVRGESLLNKQKKMAARGWSRRGRLRKAAQSGCIWRLRERASCCRASALRHPPRLVLSASRIARRKICQHTEYNVCGWSWRRRW